MTCLGYKPDEFFDLTPRAFQLAIKAYNKQQETATKLTLEAARLSGFLAARPAMSAESQNKYWCPQLFYPFPWDEKVKQTTKPAPSEKHIEKAQRLLKKWPKGKV